MEQLVHFPSIARFLCESQRSAELGAALLHLLQVLHWAVKTAALRWWCTGMYVPWILRKSHSLQMDYTAVIQTPTTA